MSCPMEVPSRLWSSWVILGPFTPFTQKGPGSSKIILDSYADQRYTVLMYNNRVYGSKYDSKLSTKEIAAKIRQDIKAAIKAGQLPQGLKVSVRYDHFSGGTSIDCRVTAWPVGFGWINPEWVMLTKDDPCRYHAVARYTEQAKAVIDHLKSIHDAYNHDGSDSMIDHFDVKYYGGVDVDWTLEGPAVERICKE